MASPTPYAHDLVLLLEACSARMGDEVLSRVRKVVGDDVRFHDGYVFQHLVLGPVSVTELARRLGVTQQAASKQVADLEQRRLVERLVDESDRRTRLITLSERGRSVVEAGRDARRDIDRELRRDLGDERVSALLSGLAALSDEIGALDELAARRLRPERSR